MKAPLKAPRDLVPKLAFTKRPADGMHVRSIEPWLDSVQREASAIITKYFRGYLPEDDHGDFLVWVYGMMSWPPCERQEPPRPPKRVREAARVLLLARWLRDANAAGETELAVVYAVELGVRAEQLNLARHVELGSRSSAFHKNNANVRWSKTEETAAERKAKYVRWEKADAKLHALSGRARSRRLSEWAKKRGDPGASFGNMQKVLCPRRARSRRS